MWTVAASAPAGDGTALARDLDQLELDIYVGLAGIDSSAQQIASQARDAGLVSLAARADLLRSDVLSRDGRLADALAVQRAIADAARQRRDSAIEARANCQIASTYSRLSLWSESVTAAELAIRLLDDDSPDHWPAEHYMVLALFTSYARIGTIDYGLFDEALRRAREHGHPLLVLAVLNNYAYTAAQREDEKARAQTLVDEMEAIVARDEASVSIAVTDTIAWVRLAQGDTARARVLLEGALAGGARVEPDDEAAVLAHLAEVHRREGDFDHAAALLERARATAMAAGTPEVAVAALRTLAELDADRGDHRRAYRRLVRFIDERDAAERYESERRATAFQAIHGTALERDRRRHYERLSTRDALTGLYNRRHLEAQAPSLIAAGALALVLIDIDHFKAINDAYSHATGDKVLTELGRLLEAAASYGDGFAARLGGEEFVLVLPGASEAQGVTVAERLRRGVAANGWRDLPATVRPTISCGVAASDPAVTTLSDLLAQADERLYTAKDLGRNRTVDGDGVV